ncbi:thermonuclease family protein [Halosimplex aquaticum]
MRPTRSDRKSGRIADDAPQPPEGGSGDTQSAPRDVGELNFYSTASLVDGSGDALTDDSLVAVWAEDSATNTDADGNGDAFVYEDEQIPLAAIDDDAGVVGFGATLVSDGASLDGSGNEDEFVLNVWDEQLGGSGTVQWDEGHGQYEDYRLDNFSTFESAAEDAGYTVEATESVPSDTESVDGYVVAVPDEGAAFGEDEREALQSFVDDGGVVFCHGVADYDDYDGTGTLNGVLDALGADFRFNDDQVEDEEHNEGAPFDLLTGALNTEQFPYLDSSAAALEAEYPYLATWGKKASAFAAEQLSAGTRATLSFDPKAQVYDDFGRVLGYLTYDRSGDGSRETLYNEVAVREGYARVYGSSYSRHDEFWAAEDAAREEGAGVWAASNPDESSPIRQGRVAEIFAPNPASVVRASGTVPPGHARVFAESSAEQRDADTTYDREIPLAAVDKGAGLAYLGAPLISEDYEAAEGYPVDTAGYDNFAFVTNLIDELADDDGPVLIEGGHNQFHLDYSLSSEDAAYYQRYLEGVDTQFEQVNDVTSSDSAERLDEAKALIVATPMYEFTDEEIDAVSSFADDGGAVVLLGSGLAPAAQRSHLDDVASGVGSDLRLGSGRVVDESSNLNGDPGVVTTGNFGPGRGRAAGRTRGTAATEMATAGEGERRRRRRARRRRRRQRERQRPRQGERRRRVTSLGPDP